MNEMNEKTIVCKQCGLELPESEFKQYQSRSQGYRNVQPTSRYTICKHCEKMSAYADKLHKRYESGAATETDLKERAALMSYYQGLVDSGLPLVTAAVRRLMGVPDERKRKGAPSKVLSMIEEMQRRREAAMNDIGCVPANEVIKPVEHETAAEVSKEATVLSSVDKAVDVLKKLVDIEFTEAPSYYEERCDYAVRVIREANGGVVPQELESLASEVLDKIDEYVDAWENGGAE